MFNFITLFWSYIIFDIFGLIRRRESSCGPIFKESSKAVPEKYASNVFDDLAEEDTY